MPLTREVAIIFGLILICSSSSQYAGKSFQLTRLVKDEFKNPTATKCDWQAENERFCKDTNSRCYRNCCSCICEEPKSTFDRRVMKCQISPEIRSGCSVRFKNFYDSHPIKLLNLKKKGEETLSWRYKNGVWNDKIKSFNVLSIASYHDGKVAMKSFLEQKGKLEKKNGNYETKIKWDQVSNEYYGLIFRVNISYEIERKSGKEKSMLNIKDCFVFKSSGSIKVTFPSLSSTTLSPSTTEESTSPVPSSKKTPTTTPDTKSSSTTPDTKSSSTTPDTKSSSTTPDTKSSSTTPTGKTETMTTTGEQAKTVNPVHTNKMSTFESSTTSKNTASPGAREKSSGDENDNTVVVSLVVVACIVFIVAVILVVWWKRRQSGRASKQNNQATIITNKGANNPMIMSPMESIYAEADNSVNYLQEKEKNSNVYDYATGNLESNYTSLDLSKVESDPVYHSLCDSHNQPGVTGQCVSGKTATPESFYHVVEGPGTTQYPEKNDNCKIREVSGRSGHEDTEGVYSVLEECDDNPERVYSVLEVENPESDYLKILGEGAAVNSGTDDNPERVYSVLEDENPELDYLKILGEGAAVNSGSDDNPERVYSVLEDENPESDYLTILGESSEYEQPINPPVSDS